MGVERKFLTSSLVHLHPKTVSFEICNIFIASCERTFKTVIQVFLLYTFVLRFFVDGIFQFDFFVLTLIRSQFA